MAFKAIFVTASILVLLSIVGFAVYFLRQAALEADASHASLKAESECTAKVDSARRVVTERADPSGGSVRVTSATSHYNNLLRQCYVEVTTEETGENEISMRTLISTAENSAVLWSVQKHGQDKDRRCFAQDATTLDCKVADQRWKAYMHD